MGRIAAASGTLYMLSVRPREQQVAEKSYGGTCIYTNLQLHSKHLENSESVKFEILHS